MDLSFGPEYEEFRAEVQTFLREHGGRSPRNAGMRAPESLAWQKLLIENGYTARTIPKEYGGFGAPPDIIKSRIIAEEFADARVNTGLGGQGISMLVPTLLEMGTEAQKLELIKPTIQGEMIWCQGYSEPGAGSDLASLTTRAVLDGDEARVANERPQASPAVAAARRAHLPIDAHAVHVRRVLEGAPARRLLALGGRLVRLRAVELGLALGDRVSLRRIGRLAPHHVGFHTMANVVNEVARRIPMHR